MKVYFCFFSFLLFLFLFSVPSFAADLPLDSDIESDLPDSNLNNIVISFPSSVSVPSDTDTDTDTDINSDIDSDMDSDMDSNSISVRQELVIDNSSELDLLTSINDSIDSLSSSFSDFASDYYSFSPVTSNLSFWLMVNSFLLVLILLFNNKRS